MNYELKYIHPGSMALNALRIAVVIGVFYALLVVFSPSSAVHFFPFRRKLFLVLTLTTAYTLVGALLSTVTAFLYNFYAGKFRGLRIRLEADSR